MTIYYTVAVRDKRKGAPFRFIVNNGDGVLLTDTTTNCSHLSRSEAGMARDLMIDGARLAGRPIDAKVVRIQATKRNDPLPYPRALQWIIDNDDSTFIAELKRAEREEDMPPPLVSVAMVADIYDRDQDDVMADLRKLALKMEAA